ncbi:D-alanine--D-alanine ligase family protein [Couchioplanes azureus]|uniref:D-alanine--D-alanine ligase family protein n=1 Tax=Couchioplanes caeruleus TaxID=56438 RepID=UPI0019BE49C7|nr:D-alanine--D-alanine ligase family protein [Couchioplanes caeruleus]GGQ69218.1 D-alanine--D-alanine ligase [Couchioplanes caeruleus subsp. azureus]
MPPTVRVAVLFGGRSTEHDVSCRSAAGVVQSLDRSRYEVVPVRISVEGEWIVGTDRATAEVDEAVLRAMTPEPDGWRPTLVESLFRALEALRDVDVVMPILHGPYGEDGTVQSVLELAGIPYVGSGVLASAASMDKEFTKKILAAEGIGVADGVVLRGDNDAVTAAERSRLSLPAFVKPARGGSSIGVSRVDDWAELPAAVEAARLCDAKVLVEAGVPGREIDVGVLELPDGRLVASPPLEIRVTTGFFDYDAKYREGRTEFCVPADVDPDTTEWLGAEAIRVFRTLGCAGLLRVDFFVDPHRGLTVNEVNTMPGLTAMSQFPRMWQAAGTPYPELLDLLIATALAGANRPAAVR